MTKRDLQEYYWVCRNIALLEDRLLELETEATKMTTTLKHDPRSDGYSKDKLAGVVAKIVDVEDEINRQVERLCTSKAKIEKAVEGLPRVEGHLIKTRYLDFRTWGQVCTGMDCSRSQAYRIHVRALKILDQKELS